MLFVNGEIRILALVIIDRGNKGIFLKFGKALIKACIVTPIIKYRIYVGLLVIALARETNSKIVEQMAVMQHLKNNLIKFRR